MQDDRVYDCDRHQHVVDQYRDAALDERVAGAGEGDFVIEPRRRQRQAIDRRNECGGRRPDMLMRTPGYIHIEEEVEAFDDGADAARENEADDDRKKNSEPSLRLNSHRAPCFASERRKPAIIKSGTSPAKRKRCEVLKPMSQ
jgi:hypothetical protein